MTSQGENQVRAILGDTLSNTKLLIMFGVFAIALLMGVSIKDNNLKICFWLSLILVIVCLINLNLSLSFYIKLRNDKGIQGQRGERGDKGPKGFPGRCELGYKREIKHCREKIISNLMKTCKNYNDLVSKRDIDRTPDETNNISIYNKWIEKIHDDCKKKGKSQDEETYFDKIFKDSSKYCLV